MLVETIAVPPVPLPKTPFEPIGPRDGGPLSTQNTESPKDVKLGGLVLTRHPGESIMIGDEVEVEVAAIRSGTVRLKIVAPRTIPVHRREIYDSIRAESEATPAEPVSSRPGKPSGGLVLARSARQSIMIGHDVELAVVEVPTRKRSSSGSPRPGRSPSTVERSSSRSGTTGPDPIGRPANWPGGNFRSIASPTPMG